jgi:preprotein translocase subunit SecG
LPWVFIIPFCLNRVSFTAAPERKQAVLDQPVSWLSTILNTLVLLTGIFLIFLVLIQRGKGGGLAGAFGGVGGSSAFGSRAGDLFTRITLGVAAAWVLLIIVHVKVVQSERQPTSSASAPASPE